MKTSLAFSTVPAFFVWIFSFPPPGAMPGGGSRQQSAGDTLVSRSCSPDSVRRESPFKLLPRFHPGKDTAGLQLIPVYPPTPTTEMIELPPSLNAPEIVREVEPVYPDSAKSLGLEGTVLVQIRVDVHGIPSRVDVLKSDAHVFNQAAIEAAMRFRFTPGGPFGVFRHEFHFRLPKNR